MLIVIRKKYLIASLFAGFAAAVLIAGARDHKEVISFAHPNSKIIVVDAGHGWPDGGAVGKSGTVECELNLAVAQKLQREMVERGYSVIMTRDGKNGIYDDENASIRVKKKSDMKKRLDLLNTSHADIFVSIHMNNFPQSKYRGSEVIYSENYLQSALLAELIHKEMIAIDPAVKPREVKKAEKTLFLLKNAQIPAVIVECGFLSNPEDEKLLNDESYQDRISAAICQGIVKYYENAGVLEKLQEIKQ